MIPSFSVCIPNYNYAHYIGQTIQSVLDQTYPHFEIVVADNASTDNSVEVVESFRSDRIRLVRNRYNIGYAPNLQRVTMFARNDFMILLSSDDLMRPNALEEYARVLVDMGDQAYNTVINSQAEVIDEHGQVIALRVQAHGSFANEIVPPDARPSAGESDSNYLVQRGYDALKDALRRLGPVGNFCTTMYPHALWEAVEGYNSVRHISPDMHFIHKLLSLDPILVHIPRPLFAYRVHSSNQASQEARQASLKLVIDQYFYTLDYSDTFLRKYDLTHAKLVRVFVEQDCLREAFGQLRSANYSRAFRLLTFAIAAYPQETLRNPKTYSLLAMLLLGPWPWLFVRSAYDWYKRATGQP